MHAPLYMQVMMIVARQIDQEVMFTETGNMIPDLDIVQMQTVIDLIGHIGLQDIGMTQNVVEIIIICITMIIMVLDMSMNTIIIMTQ